MVITGTGATVVIDAALASSLRRDVQLALEGDEPVVAFLSALTADGVRDLPSFAYVGREGTAARILLRGEIVAVARTSERQETELTAGSVSTWTEVVQSDCVEVDLCTADVVVAVVSYGVPEPLVAEPVGEPAASEDLASAGAQEDGPAPSQPPSGDETIVAAAEAMAVVDQGSDGDEVAADVDLPPVAVPVDVASTDDEVDLSHLFDTRHVGVEAAAIRAETPVVDTPPAVRTPSAALPPVASPLADLPPPVGAPISAPPPAGLIAGVPGAPAQAPGFAPEPPGDHDGLTISPAQLASLRGGTVLAGSTRASGPVGPQLQAVACSAGHLNPPQADRCRSCGAVITDRSIRVVSRPTLGFLDFDGGTSVDIDRPLLIGRKPTADGLAPGAELPGLVVLPDPEGSLSRVHAEVRIEGWEVLVVDRNSTNGTYVEIPGQPPTLLRPMEPCLISPGTRLVFADVASCEFQTGPR